MNQSRIGDDLLLAMEEAALLPPRDPARRALEGALSRAPVAHRVRWRALVDETAALRRALTALRLPVGFEARLLAAPDATAGRGRARRAITAVAAAALVVGMWLTAISAWTAHRVSVVAALAAANHARDTHLTVKTTDAVELERALTAALGFQVQVPELAPGTQIVGGRKCALAAAPVAYVALRNGDVECAVYVFEATGVGLPDAMDRRAKTVRIDGGASALVDVWCRDGIGFALVSPNARVLDTK